MAKDYIFCTTIGDKNNFYLNHNGEKYYLFSQKYKSCSVEYYENGVTIDKAINSKNFKRSLIYRKTAEKILSSIRYLEKEYDLSILNRTKILKGAF